MCGIKSVPNMVQRGAAAQTGPQDWGEPQGMGQLSSPSPRSVEGISQSALVPGGLWAWVEGDTCCGKFQEGSSFFLLKGRIHDSDLRRSPDVCLGICITRRICEDYKDAPQNSGFTLSLRRRDCNIPGNIFPPWGKNKYNRGLLCS